MSKGEPAQQRSSRTRRLRGQLALLFAAAVTVATLVPLGWSLADHIGPYIGLLVDRTGLAPSADSATVGPGPRGSDSGRTGSEPRGGEGFPAGPEAAAGFDNSLGAAYERVTELPPTLQFIERATERFAKARSTFVVGDSASEALHVGVSHGAKLTLSLDTPMTTLKRELAGDAQGKRHLEEISTIIEAELEAPGFSVSPADPVRHTVGRERQLEWSWTVTPRDLGRSELTVRLTPLFVVSGVEYAETLPPQTLTVDVTESRWARYIRVMDSGGLLGIAGVLLVLAAYIIGRHARRKATD